MLNRLLSLSTFYDPMSWVLLVIPMLQMKNLKLGKLKGSAQGQSKGSTLQLHWTTREVPLGILVASPHRIPGTSSLWCISLLLLPHFPTPTTLLTFLGEKVVWVADGVIPGGQVVKNQPAMQGTGLRSLVWEDPTCLGATKPMSHNYWGHVLQLRKPVHLEPTLQNRSHQRAPQPE